MTVDTAANRTAVRKHRRRKRQHPRHPNRAATGTPNLPSLPSLPIEHSASNTVSAHARPYTTTASAATASHGGKPSRQLRSRSPSQPGQFRQSRWSSSFRPSRLRWRVLSRRPRPNLLSHLIPNLLRHNRSFAILFAGQVVSLAGSGASTVAFPLLTLWLTHSATQAGLVGALRLLAYAVLCLPAGVLVDRWDRRRVMLFCDTGRAFLLSAIPVAAALGHLTIWMLASVAFAEGSCFTFYDLAATAVLPGLVAAEQLETAASLTVTATNSAQLVGPLVGGSLYGIGRTIPMLADALTYLVSTVSLLFVRITPSTSQVAEESGQAVANRSPAHPAAHSPTSAHRSPSKLSAPGTQKPSRRQLWRNLSTDMRAGLRWLWRHRLLRALAVASGAANLVLSAYPLVLLLLAQRLDVRPITTGLVLTGAGVGGVLGPALYVRLRRRLGFAVLFFGAQVIEGLLWLGSIFAHTSLALAVLALATMTADQVCNMTQYSLRLVVIPQPFLARVNSVYRLLLVITQPIGLGLVGALVDHVDVSVTTVVCVLALGLVTVAAVCTPALRCASLDIRSRSPRRRAPHAHRAQRQHQQLQQQPQTRRSRGDHTPRPPRTRR